ncbi:putative membrane protein [Sporosarcina luteola]|nr:putative membrane protein [Sporosarcina luteola]
MEWKNIYRGFLMGISDLIPGVSGGTIAFILGIYDRLLAAISGFFSREWKKHIGFLLPLAVGIGITFVLFSRVIDYLLKNYNQPTQFFFLGLIIGILPFISKQADMRTNFKFGHYVLLLFVGVALASTAFIKPIDADVITSLTGKNAIGLFLAGWAGSMAMLLPGISGSFILLLLGVYPTAINALSTMNLPLIAVIGAGVIVGFIVSAKAIAYLLRQYTHSMFAIIIGLILGSIFVIYPGIPESGTPFVMSAIALVTGIIVANMFSVAENTTK